MLCTLIYSAILKLLNISKLIRSASHGFAPPVFVYIQDLVVLPFLFLYTLIFIIWLKIQRNLENPRYVFFAVYYKMRIHYYYLDVDRFLCKDDFALLSEWEWPWLNTHFIRTVKCYYCNYNADPSIPYHFMMQKNQVKYLLNNISFWCPGCFYMLAYDHFPADECEYCNSS